MARRTQGYCRELRQFGERVYRGLSLFRDCSSASKLLFKEKCILKSGLSQRTFVIAAVACLLAVVCSCSSHARSEGLRTQETSPTGTIAASTGVLNLELTNFTGSTLQAVYVSPSHSTGWEENVLGGDELNDGKTLDISFSPEESATLWDIKVESTDKHSAEWKNLDLRGASRITLLLESASEPVAVAEVE